MGGPRTSVQTAGRRRAAILRPRLDRWTGLSIWVGVVDKGERTVLLKQHTLFSYVFYGPGTGRPERPVQRSSRGPSRPVSRRVSLWTDVRGPPPYCTSRSGRQTVHLWGRGGNARFAARYPEYFLGTCPVFGPRRRIPDTLDTPSPGDAASQNTPHSTSISIEPSASPRRRVAEHPGPCHHGHRTHRRAAAFRVIGVGVAGAEYFYFTGREAAQQNISPYTLDKSRRLC